MHILAGIILTRLLSGNNNKGFKGFIGVIEIRHFLSGRVRFFVPVLKNEPEKCQQIKNHLEKASQLKSVVANPITGSLLIEFDNEKIDIETITGVVVKILGLEETISKTPKSLVTKELKSIFKSMNTGIYEYTKGMMDLNSVITTSFLSLGIYALISKRNFMPSGLSLLYWTYMNMQGD